MAIQNSFSQCTPITASVSNQVCLQENILIANTTTAASFEWDFCPDNLKETPTPNLSGTLSTFSTAVDLKVINDGANWYAFVLDLSNRITRVDFGNSPNNTPTYKEFGNIGGILSSPSGMDIVKEGNNWYGVIVNSNSSQLLLLNFGTSLDTTPTVSILFSSLAGSDPFGVVRLVPMPGGGHTVLVTEFSSRNIKIIPFVNGLEQSAGTAINVSFPSARPLDIQAVETCGNWSLFVVGFDTKAIYRLDFGNDFQNVPTIQQISASFSFYPYRVWAGREGDEFYCFVANSNGGLYKLELGMDLHNNSPVGTDLGNLGVLVTSYNLSIINDSGKWSAFMVNGVNNPPLYRISFPENCGSNTSISALSVPQNVSYTTSGSKKIALTALQIGNTTSTSFPLVVQNLQVPDIDFIAINNCVNHDVNFVTKNLSGNLISYDWDFGDGSVHAITPNPLNQYGSAATYAVNLKVTADNGCGNSVTRDLKIYVEPSPLFSFPQGLICTNNEFTFTNGTVDSFDGNLTYQWLVDNNPESTARDFKYAFTSVGNKAIKLITSIPGCSNESIQSIQDVQSGPSVGFTTEGKCEDVAINFTNISSGNIAGYLWDFGNGQTSQAINVSQTYSNTGDYVVSLETVGNNGCVSKTSKTLRIYSTPQPNFSLDLPPFSCAGTPSQFNDLTPSLTDSNVTSWNWSFGDPLNGAATVKNPSYIFSAAGSYDVALATTTNFGCTNSITKTVQIVDPPKGDFKISPACLNQPAYFTDTSAGSNKSWLWKIGNSSYTIQNPAHVFSNPGDYLVQLAITGSNNCIATLTRTINVPVPPILDFSVKNDCAGQATVFEDITSQSADRTILENWDFAGRGSATGSPVNFMFSEPGAYNVNLKVTNQSGCSYSLSKNISIAASPIAEFTSSVESGPPPLSVQFANTSLNASSYEWRFNDPSNAISSTPSPTFTYNSLGDFVVDLTATNDRGCSNTLSKIIHIIIPRTELELEEFTLLRDAATGSLRPVLTIRNNGNYTVGSVEAIIDIGGKALVKERISTSIRPNVSTSEAMNYELLTSANSFDYLCVTLSIENDAQLENNSACINLESDEILFAPYPNPIQGELHFKWISNTTGSAHVRIMSQMGQVAFQKDGIDSKAGLNEVILDVSKLNSGLYVLIFEGSASPKTFSILILN